METIRAPEDVNRAIDAMVNYIGDLVDKNEEWLLVGIANGGIPLAKRIAALLKEKRGINLQLGSINVNFHRDDIGSRPITNPKVPTLLPLEIDRSCVILVDDVVHSGRTTRAALEELFEQGRPRVTRLLTLVDRGNRVLPIQPDFSAMAVDLEDHQKLKVVVDPEDDQGNRIWITTNSE
ncbi:MAG: bifunctional pyr operon transcriptional regulator/uracil phosphoribosyltransferase PyrR [Opitutales bacterium]|nr:bifunctional pyr operon transcriptional regulator/uracil phosphoribosyltransferase PyrR [Opitutales bacterium]